jgi:endoglucanase
MFRHPKTLAVLAAVLAIAVPAAAAEKASAPTTAPGIRVAGNRLIDNAGVPLRIAGVNRSGAEYACAQGWGIFDGPADDASVAAMASWGVNAVRVLLNEDCWLGINGVKPQYAGANYQAAIRSYVDLLHAHGLDVILDLHWGAPGNQLALGQEDAPDADHAPAFWSSVAAQYKGVAGIAYDLFNEPHDISWSCWLSGCTTASGFRVAGQQQLIDAVRSAGATQPVIVEGLQWGGDLSGWLSNRPSDPAGQLVAGWHTYNFSVCNTADCWNSTIAPLARQIPVLATEVGENDCGGSYLGTLLAWADSHQIGYLAWTWNAASCAQGPSLLVDYTGTPTAYGAWYKTYVTARTASTKPPDPTARFDFENGRAQGWILRWGDSLVVSNEAGVAWTGSHGLALDVFRNGTPAVGVSTGLKGIVPRAVVTFHIWAPAGVAAGISPLVFDSGWQALKLPNRSLAAGWNTVRFTIPGSVAGVRLLGLQVNDDSLWAGRLILDTVSCTVPAGGKIRGAIEAIHRAARGHGASVRAQLSG